MSQNPEDYIDEYDKNTSELVKKIKKNRFSENSIICKKAADQIIQSANPEAQKIYSFLMGLSKFEGGKAEKDPVLAKKLFQEAIQFLESENTDNKENNELLEDAKFALLKKEVVINEGDNSKLADLFGRMAKICAENGWIEDYHTSMGFAYMYEANSEINSNPINFVNKLDESIKHFEKISFEQALFKMRGMKYRYLSLFQPTYQQRLVLLNKQLYEIEKTDDKVGVNDCKANIVFTTAQIEKDWRQKKSYLINPLYYLERIEIIRHIIVPRSGNFFGRYIILPWG